MSFDDFAYYLKYVRGENATDQTYYFDQGAVILGQGSGIVVICTDSTLKNIQAVSVFVKPSEFERGSAFATQLNVDAIFSWLALTKCKSYDTDEIREALLSLGLVVSYIDGTNVEGATVEYGDFLLMLDVNYDEDDASYTIMKNPYVEKPKFKEFE